MSSSTTNQLPDHIPAQIKKRVEALRDTGHTGGIISPHRALLTMPLQRREFLPALALALLLLVLYIFSLHWVAAGWASILHWCLDLFGYHHVRIAYYGFSVADYNIYTPYALLGAAVPTSGQWDAAVILTASLMLISLMLPDRYTPLAYLLRAIVMIHAISIVYFSFWPADYPYNLAGYHALMMLVGMAFIAIVPIVYCLTYYIFKISLLRKLVFTLFTMFYLGLVIPLQYFAQLYLIHTFSLLYMPVLFLIFGLMIDVFLLIALYSWAMSLYGSFHPSTRKNISRSSLLVQND